MVFVKGLLKYNAENINDEYLPKIQKKHIYIYFS